MFILQCYIKPEVLLHTEIEKLQYRNPINFLPNDKIYFGPKVAISLTQNVIDADQISSFCTNCLNFYVTCAFEMFKRFPFNSREIIALKQLSFLDPKNIEKFPSLGNISLHFPKFFTDIYALDIEWRMLKASNDIDISLNVFEFWKKHLSLTKGDDSLLYPELATLVTNIFCLPHSSAAVERIFSQVNLNKTKQRNHLGNMTLNGILHSKQFISKNNKDCYTFEISKNLLDKHTQNMCK